MRVVKICCIASVQAAMLAVKQLGGIGSRG
jgi:hypothetical protein